MNEKKFDIKNKVGRKQSKLLHIACDFFLNISNFLINLRFVIKYSNMQQFDGDL